MSDHLNKDDEVLSFKDQILRDLEILKATVNAEDRARSRESELAKEEADMLEATEASLQNKLTLEETLEEAKSTDADPVFKMSDIRAAMTPETPTPTRSSAPDFPVGPDLSKEEPEQEVEEDFRPSWEPIQDPSVDRVESLAEEAVTHSDLTEESGTGSLEADIEDLTVPDFVAAQAQRFAEARAQIDAELAQADGVPGFDPHAGIDLTEASSNFGSDSFTQGSASTPETDDLGETRKVPIHFNAEQLDLSEVDVEATGITPIPKRAVDQIEDELATTNHRSRQLQARPARRRRQQDDQPPTKGRDRTGKKIVSGVILSLLVALVLVGVAGFFFIKDSLSPVDANATKDIVVEIPSGATNKEVGQVLEQAGLIKNATVFYYNAKFKGYDGFQSGNHTLRKSMDVDTISKKLQEQGVAVEETKVGKIVIPEGYTLKQIAQSMTLNAGTPDDETDKSPFTAEEFMAVVEDEAFIAEMVAKYPRLLETLPTKEAGAIYRLEGYLFPATYDYTETTTVRDLVDQMLSAMNTNLSPFYDQIAARGLTVNQVLTIASLVEKEGSKDEDRKNIASVFFNRLQYGMALQSNIAILYAEGKLGEKTTLAEDVSIDTQIQSPYNIYTNLGYMPGPVDNPGLSAITATVLPNQTNYFYFVADVTTGAVYFAATYEEHAVNVETYVNSHLNGTNPAGQETAPSAEQATVPAEVTPAPVGQ